MENMQTLTEAVIQAEGGTRGSGAVRMQNILLPPHAALQNSETLAWIFGQLQLCAI